MQKISKIVLIALVIFSFSATKSWAIIHVGASIPVTGKYDWKDSKDQKNISGYGLSLVIPFGMMFRYDALTGKDSSAKVESSIFSIGYRFDLPLLPFHLAAAAGIGTSKFKTGADSSFEHNGVTYKAEFSDPVPKQLYLEAGYEIFPLFDLVLGLHFLESKALELAYKPDVPSDWNSLEDDGDNVYLKGTVLSLGIVLGF